MPSIVVFPVPTLTLQIAASNRASDYIVVLLYRILSYIWFRRLLCSLCITDSTRTYPFDIDTKTYFIGTNIRSLKALILAIRQDTRIFEQLIPIRLASLSLQMYKWVYTNCPLPQYNNKEEENLKGGAFQLLLQCTLSLHNESQL